MVLVLFVCSFLLNICRINRKIKILNTTNIYPPAKPIFAQAWPPWGRGLHWAQRDSKGVKWTQRESKGFRGIQRESKWFNCISNTCLHILQKSMWLGCYKIDKANFKILGISHVSGMLVSQPLIFPILWCMFSAKNLLYFYNGLAGWPSFKQFSHVSVMLGSQPFDFPNTLMHFSANKLLYFCNELAGKPSFKPLCTECIWITLILWMTCKMK